MHEPRAFEASASNGREVSLRESCESDCTASYSDPTCTRNPHGRARGARACAKREGNGSTKYDDNVVRKAKGPVRRIEGIWYESERNVCTGMGRAFSELIGQAGAKEAGLARAGQQRRARQEDRTHRRYHDRAKSPSERPDWPPRSTTCWLRGGLGTGRRRPKAGLRPRAGC